MDPKSLQVEYSYSECSHSYNISLVLPSNMGCSDPDFDQSQLVDEQVLSHIYELKRREGEVSKQLLREHKKLVSPEEVERQFDSFEEAKKMAGVAETKTDHSSESIEYSEEEYRGWSKPAKTCNDLYPTE